MQQLIQTRKGSEKFLAFLALFGYLTAEQLRRVAGYQPKSLGFVRQKLNSLVAAGFVLALPGRFVTSPGSIPSPQRATPLHRRWEYKWQNALDHRKSGQSPKPLLYRAYLGSE
jgi:hypothetical protein